MLQIRAPSSFELKFYRVCLSVISLQNFILRSFLIHCHQFPTLSLGSCKNRNVFFILQVSNSMPFYQPPCIIFIRFQLCVCVCVVILFFPPVLELSTPVFGAPSTAPGTRVRSSHFYGTRPLWNTVGHGCLLKSTSCLFSYFSLPCNSERLCFRTRVNYSLPLLCCKQVTSM